MKLILCLFLLLDINLAQNSGKAKTPPKTQHLTPAFVVSANDTSDAIERASHLHAEAHSFFVQAKIEYEKSMQKSQRLSKAEPDFAAIAALKLYWIAVESCQGSAESNHGAAPKDCADSENEMLSLVRKSLVD